MDEFDAIEIPKIEIPKIENTVTEKAESENAVMIDPIVPKRNVYKYELSKKIEDISTDNEK